MPPSRCCSLVSRFGRRSRIWWIVCYYSMDLLNGRGEVREGYSVNVAERVVPLPALLLPAVEEGELTGAAGLDEGAWARDWAGGDWAGGD